MGVADQAVEDGIDDGGVANLLAPMIHGALSVTRVVACPKVTLR